MEIKFYIIILSQFRQTLNMGCQQSGLQKLMNQERDVISNDISAKNRKKFKNQRFHRNQQTGKIQENIHKITYLKTDSDIQFIQNAISKHFLLFKLKKQQRRQLANAMDAYQTDAGQYVFLQGTTATMFFIINDGQVQIQINNEPVRAMKRGDFFGQLAIIYSSPRSASVKVTKKCTFWCLSQHIFLRIQKEMVKNNYKIAKPYVNKLPIFKYLTSMQRNSISYLMNTLKYEEKETVFKAGDDATSFYIIISGLVQITISGKASLQLKNGDSFGENCLKQNQTRSGTAICIQNTQLLAIGRQDLKSCLGAKSQQEVLFHNIIKWSLRRSKIFSSTTAIEQQKIIAAGQFICKQDQQIIIKKDQNDENLYICLQGKINDYDIGQIVNENQAMADQVELFLSQQTLTKKGRGFYFFFPLKLIHKQKIQKFKKNDSLNSSKLSKVYQEITKEDSIIESKIDFKDLYIIGKLGEGQMGKILLVQDKKTEKRYALKCIQKNIVIKHEMEKFIKAEKEILQICDYSLIVKLIQSYKDSHFVYLLLKYIEGGDFFDYLSGIGICDNNIARFYLGCILLSIEYFHKNCIVYRDLKPQNAVIDSTGYLHIIDMGTAKMLSEQSDAGVRTFTIIGTPHYMAPEIFEAKGYSYPVDIWSLGIMLYQMVCGTLPYGNSSGDPISIYKEIVTKDLKFPKNYTDTAGKQLIHKFLQKNPDKRAVQDFSQIKSMQFFKNFNWELLQNQKMIAPLRPKYVQSKFFPKSEYLLNYLQRQKSKMDKPLSSHQFKWDQSF